MKKTFAIVIGLIVVAVLVVFSTTFSVAYNEIAIRSRFGKVGEDSIVRESGLHFRLPFFVDSIDLLDTRLQLLESPLETIQTKDGQQVVVRGFLLWRIDQEGKAPLDFYESYSNVASAQSSIRTQFRDALNAIGSWELDELLSKDSTLPEAEAAVLARMQEVAVGGVKPVAAGISRLVFKESTTGEVTRRMQARRETLADNERTRGEAEAQRIRSEAETTSEKILAFAAQRAQEIRTKSEERAAAYLAQMSQDEELAVFLIWIDTLEKSLSRNTTVLLETDQMPWALIDTARIRALQGTRAEDSNP
jgi:membrane protease subunit HflC